MLPLALSGGDGFAYTPPGSMRELAIPSGTVFALGDPSLQVKVHLFGQGNEGIGFAVVGWGTAPLGHLTAKNHYVGDSSPTFGGHFVGEFVAHRFRLAANLGGMWRAHETLFSTEVGPQIIYRAAAGYDITPLLTVFGELDGAATFTSQVDENPLEARLGAKLRQGDFQFGLAGARD